jgi:hypothetical protein
MLPTRERLLRNREISMSGCWLWLGKLQPNGYGMTHLGSRAKGARRKTVYVHRLAYQEWVGQIPVGCDLDHLCRVRRCFNPEHLEPVSRKENVIRGAGPALLGSRNGGKTHCKHGHSFNDENTSLRSGGGRTCRECARLRGVQGAPRSRFKDRCPHGHAFTSENTGLYKGWRYCKTCAREKARRRYNNRPPGNSQRRRLSLTNPPAPAQL